MRTKLIFSLALLSFCANTLSGQEPMRAMQAWDTEIVTVPEGLEIQRFHVDGDVMFGQNLSSFQPVDYYVEMCLDGNDVYLKGYFNSASEGWLKGQKIGSLITFKVGQNMGTAKLFDGSRKEAWLSAMNGKTKVTLKYDENAGTIKLNDTGYPLLVAGEDHQRAEVLQVTMKKLVLDDSFDFVPVVPPLDADCFSSSISYLSAINLTIDPQNPVKTREGQICIVDNDLYIRGLCCDFPEQWIKGQIGMDGQDHIVSFPINQFLGKFQGYYYYNCYSWFTAAEASLNRYGKIAFFPCDLDYITFQWDTDLSCLSLNWDYFMDEPSLRLPAIVVSENTTDIELISLDYILAFKAPFTPDAIQEVRKDAPRTPSYDLQGRKRQEAKGLCIDGGRIEFRQ